MAAASALLLCALLMFSGGPSLANVATTTTVSPAEVSGNETGGGTGHGAAQLTEVPIVTWKWHHVEAPYLVALWVLVCWLCKLRES